MKKYDVTINFQVRLPERELLYLLYTLTLENRLLGYQVENFKIEKEEIVEVKAEEPKTDATIL